MLIATIGSGPLDRSPSANGPIGALPTLAPSAKPGGFKVSLAPLSIARNGNDIKISGQLPDDSAKAALMNALSGSLPPAVNIIDKIDINPNIDALDFSNAGPVFTDSALITDLNFTVHGDTITVAGTAASPDQKNTVRNDAKQAWPNLNVVDQLVVSGPPTVTCAKLQSAIDAVTNGPITFADDGFSLTPVDEQILTQVADRLKACPDSHATINGYSNHPGLESINITSSTQYAQTVAEFLVAHGVANDRLMVKGLGSAAPVAPNDTAEGRAKNRRVEIVVS